LKSWQFDRNARLESPTLRFPLIAEECKKHKVSLTELRSGSRR
jgi:hypothetical protein